MQNTRYILSLWICLIMRRSACGAQKPESYLLKISQGNLLIFAHRFEGPKGRMTFLYDQPAKTYAGSGDQVAALASGDKDRVSAEQESDLSPWLRTTKPKPVSVQIPVRSKQVVVKDILGRQTETLRAVNGFVNIPVSEVPQYIIELRD